MLSLKKEILFPNSCLKFYDKFYQSNYFHRFISQRQFTEIVEHNSVIVYVKCRGSYAMYNIQDILNECRVNLQLRVSVVEVNRHFNFSSITIKEKNRFLPGHPKC